MAPTNPIGRDPVTGKLTEFIISTGGSATFDGGTASSVYSPGGPVLDCGHAT